MLGTTLSVVGLAADAASLYDFGSTLMTGDGNKQVLHRLEDMNARIERLSDNILYAPGFEGLTDTTKALQSAVGDLREARELLEPVQCAVGEEIVSSALIDTPDKMKSAMCANPWEVLQNITPANYAVQPNDPTMVPVMFEHSGVRYIGWQKSGTLPILFNCEFHDLPDITTAQTRQSRIPLGSANDYYNRGCSYHKKGEYERAIYDFTEAIRLAPGDIGVYNARANAYVSLDAYDRAIADYSMAIKCAPDNAMLYLNRGGAYSFKGDLQSAIADVRQALLIDPNVDRAENVRIFLKNLESEV